MVYGQYKILIYGLPVSMEYPRLLRQRYGIDMQLRGCVVTDLELAYAHGYNGVSKEAAKRKFGQDIFEKTFADAMKLKPSTRPRRDKHAPIILHIEDISGLSLVTRDSLS